MDREGVVGVVGRGVMVPLPGRTDVEQPMPAERLSELHSRKMRFVTAA